MDPLTVRAALTSGLTPAQLRAKHLRTPFHGVRVPVTNNGLDVDCRALLAVVRCSAYVSGMTAARLYGWWCTPIMATATIEITVPRNASVRRQSARTLRRDLQAHDASSAGGIRITSPARTIADLASRLPLIDLVVVIDSALHLGHCELAALEAMTTGGAGSRGVRNLRRALSLVNGLSESPMETLLRLLIVLSGLPAPTLQVNIFDIHANWLARVDMKPPGVLSVFEYDGSGHDAAAQHASDVRRWRALRAAGYEVFPYTAGDLFRRPHEIVADYQRALGLPGDPSAIRGWLTEFAKSSFAR